ncbi:MAG: tetratricopeptide repeat protein [Rhodospirillales bacterium]|nr:MAG: tetratricopeptide repeat protein [Rhodospirillales bacterium]
MSERATASHSDQRGVSYTTSGAEAMRHFDAAITAYLGFEREAGAHLERAVAADPDFAMGHCARGYFLKLFADRAQDTGTAEAIAAARKSVKERGATRRERNHIAALSAWHRGDWQGALDRWERILLDEPLDILALKLVNHLYFYLGDSLNVRDSVARVLYAWNAETPGHGFVLGMYAFGLEECGDYVGADAVGQQAIEINPADVWAIHAVLHVMEMQGRHREGTDLLKTSESVWSRCNNFANHMWWHGALLLMDLERYHAVIDGYDNRIRAERTDHYLDIANATSLLWRLEEAGIDVGDRWGELADKAEARSRDHLLPFADVHFMMALAADGRTEVAETMLQSMMASAAKGDGVAAIVTRDIGVPLCAALRAYADQDYQRVVELLEPIRYDLKYLGGSHAQQDLFHRTLVSAALKSQQFGIARALMSERTADRPSSIWNWRTYARVLAALGDEAGAVGAWRKARDLLIGLTL